MLRLPEYCYIGPWSALRSNSHIRTKKIKIVKPGEWWSMVGAGVIWLHLLDEFMEVIGPLCHHGHIDANFHHHLGADEKFRG